MSGRIWLGCLATIAGLVVLWVSVDLFLLIVLPALLVWVAVLYAQRDEARAEWGNEVFAKAGLKHKNKLLTAVNVRLLADNQRLVDDNAAIVARLAEVLDENAVLRDELAAAPAPGGGPMIRYGQPAPRMGDIGDNPREYEFEPLTTPATEPTTVPVTEPAAPEPAREPVPA